MTTIVYDGKTLAVDSQQSQGSTICGLRNKIRMLGSIGLRDAVLLTGLRRLSFT